LVRLIGHYNYATPSGLGSPVSIFAKIISPRWGYSEMWMKLIFSSTATQTINYPLNLKSMNYIENALF
jgi:hypothetical protein